MTAANIQPDRKLSYQKKLPSSDTYKCSAGKLVGKAINYIDKWVKTTLIEWLAIRR